MAHEPKVLNVPHKESSPFSKNLIQLATCELRFPILLEFESKPPIKLQSSLRKEYPRYDKNVSMTLRPGSKDPVEEIRHFFRSKKKNWTVSFRPFSIALETDTYTNFEEFKGRLLDVVKAAEETMDSDFLTRIGLRYINEIPVEQTDLEDWVNKELVSPLTSGHFGEVDRIFQEVRGRYSDGLFSLRHGYPGDGQGDKNRYIIDLDFYKEDIEVKDVGETLGSLHDSCYDLFDWTISDKARQFMGGSGGQ